MARIGREIAVGARKTLVLPLLDAANFVKKRDIAPMQTA